MRRVTVESLTIGCCALVAACGAPQITNAPPEVVEGCRREIAILTGRDPALTQDDALRSPGSEPTQTTIDDARIAREEADGTGRAGWPDDVLMYRCLESRGIVLTPEQARVLAEWEEE